MCRVFIFKEQWPCWVQVKKSGQNGYIWMGSKSDSSKIRGDPWFLSTDVSIFKAPGYSPFSTGRPGP